MVSVCLPSETSCNTYHLTWVSLTLDVGVSLHSCSSKEQPLLLLRSLGAQYDTGDQRRNNYRKNEGIEPNQKQYPVVDVTADRSKI